MPRPATDKAKAYLGRCKKAPDTTNLLLSALAGASGTWSTLGPTQNIQLAAGQPWVPSQKFKKALITAGTFVKDSEGLVFTIDLECLSNFVLQFNRMKENGVKVPIPAVHRDKKWEDAARKAMVPGDDPRDNMGCVDSMWLEGRTLMMGCTLIGTDALVAAKRSDVSIYSPSRFVDGHGNTYVRPITHVAMVVDPVVPGLGEFIPLAASLRQQEKPAMLEFLKKLAAALGLDPNTIVDETAGMDLVMQAIDALIKKAGGSGEGQGDDTGTTNPPPASQAGKGGGPVRKEVITREFAASRRAARDDADDDGPSVHPRLISLEVRNRNLELSRLCTEGKITPDQKKKLAEEWCDAEAVGLVLSAGSDGSDFERLIQVLDMNPALKMGEKSGRQTPIALSDGSKGGTNENPLLKNAQARAKAAQARASK